VTIGKEQNRNCSSGIRKWCSRWVLLFRQYVNNDGKSHTGTWARNGKASGVFRKTRKTPRSKTSLQLKI